MSGTEIRTRHVISMNMKNMNVNMGVNTSLRNMNMNMTMNTIMNTNIAMIIIDMSGDAL